MTRKFSFALAAGLMGLALASCGTSNVGVGGSPDRDASAFKLNVLSDSFVDGASAAGFDLSVDDYGQDIVVNVKAKDAKNLKALYFSLDYNPEQYRPLTAAPSKDAGSRDDMLTLNVMKDRGTVWYGQVLSNYNWKSGMSGDGTVAHVNFRKERTPVFRTVSAAPVSNLSAAPLSFDGTDTLNWYYTSQGDYDQNGETFLADLTPLGLHLGDVGPFDISSNVFVVDGDQNTQVTLADLTPIGVNFQKTVDGYNIYNSQDAADAPPTGTPADNGSASTTTLLGTVAFNTATGAVTDHKAFQFVVAAPVANDFYWVRPFSGTAEGTRSNLVGGNTGLLAQLTLTSPPSGAGTLASPYVANDATVYTFSVIDPTDGDVSTDAQTVYSVSNPGAGAMGAGVNTLDVTDGFTGAFNVSVTYKGVPTNPSALFFSIGVTPPGGLFIRPDAADADWASVTGAGTSADPYICAVNGGFNSDFSAIFDLEANTASDFTGTAVDVTTLTWAADPPFIATFGTPGSFTVNQFTNGEVFATNADPAESNHLFVVSQALPST